jgi:hypothetical protein
MRIDFWNNPILVTSVRRRFRGGLLQVVFAYPLFLMLIGAVLPYFFPRLGQDWPYYAFNVLMIWQYFMSGMLATLGTANSLKSEITNQTLDFLRLTPLSPRQILIGKLLGEITAPVFYAVASIPVGVLCWGLGGVPLHLLLLLYVNLFVYVVVCGASGLVMRLEMRDDKRVEANVVTVSGGAAGLACLGTISMSEPLRSAALLSLPVPLLLLSYVNFRMMERSLENPLNPPLSKGLAYVLLPLMSIVFAIGVHAFFTISPGQRAVLFWCAQTMLTINFIVGLTAWREVLRSWVWRFRDRVPRQRDDWLGDRTGNTSAVLTLILIALVCYLVMFLPLAWLGSGTIGMIEEAPALMGAPVLSVALLVLFGAIYQWTSFLLGRNRQGLTLLFMLALGAPSVLGFGVVPETSWLAFLSPFAHYAKWYQDPETLQPLLPLVVFLMLFAGVVAWRSYHSMLSRLERAIDRKLEKMGVLQRTGRAGDVSPPVEHYAGDAAPGD